MTWRSTAHIPKTAAEARLLQGFTQTDEMRAADEAVRNSTPETEPENWTKTANYGWIYTGPLRTETTATKAATYKNSHMGGPDHDARRQYKTGAWGWHLGGDLMEQNAPGVNSGIYGNFTDESWKRFQEAGFRGNPLIDTNPHDIAAILEQYKDPNYNPYLDVGKWDQGARGGSVADVLYGLMKNDYGNRGEVYQAVRNLKDMGNLQMTSQVWNDAGLNEILGEYGDRVGGGMSKVDWIKSGGGMMSGLNNLPKIDNSSNTPRAERNVWGNGMFSDENSAMRQAIGDQLEKKLLG